MHGWVVGRHEGNIYVPDTRRTLQLAGRRGRESLQHHGWKERRNSTKPHVSKAYSVEFGVDDKDLGSQDTYRADSEQEDGGARRTAGCKHNNCNELEAQTHSKR